MSKRNIVTAMAAVAAAMLVIIVILKTNDIGGRDITTASTAAQTETVIESSVVLMSEIDENGDIGYYTMLSSYAKPKVSSNFVYPSTVPRSTKPGETTRPFVEYSITQYMLDEQGNNVLDENGNPIFEVVYYTEYVTEPTTTTQYIPITNFAPVTDASGVAITNADGTPVTDVVVLNPTTTVPVTTAAGSTSERRTLLPQVTFPSSRDDDAEDNIVAAINQARSEAGLTELKVGNALRGTAYVSSMKKVYPDFDGISAASGDSYSLLNVEGTDIAAAVMNGSIGKNAAMKADYTKIGVAVVKAEGKYYTTIIFQ